MLRIRQSIRYLRVPKVGSRFFTQSSFKLNNVHQTQDLKHQISTLLERIPGSEDVNNQAILRGIIGKLPEDQMSKVSARVLGLTNASIKNNVLINLALQTVKPEDISPQVLENLVRIAHELSTQKKPPKPVQTELTKIFLAACDDELIEKIRLGIEEYDGAFNKSVLVTLLLKTKRYGEAHELVLNTLRAGGRIRGFAIELVINHLCHLNKLHESEELIRLATLPSGRRYDLFPRTYSTFLSKAVELNEHSICRRIHKHILDRTYIDNGTLVRLAECLAHDRDFFCIYGLKEIAMKKRSFPPDFMKRINRSIVDCIAHVQYFEKAWEVLEEFHQGEELEVVDYPYLKNSINIEDSDELNNLLHGKMKLVDHQLRQFALNLVVSRLAEARKVGEAYHLINRSDSLKAHVNESTILQLAHGADIAGDIDTLNRTCELVISLDLKLKQRKTIDLLLMTILDTDYWFQSFKMLERCEIEDYAIRPELFSKLKAKCEQFGSTQHLQYE